MDDGFQDRTAEVINILFREITYSCPAFRQSWPTQSDFDNVKKLWLRAFLEEEFNDLELIRKGLIKLAMKEKAFVPTCGQFIAICKEKENKPLAPYHLPYFDEDTKKSDPSIQENEIDKMRAILGMKR